MHLTHATRSMAGKLRRTRWNVNTVPCSVAKFRLSHILYIQWRVNKIELNMNRMAKFSI